MSQSSRQLLLLILSLIGLGILLAVASLTKIFFEVELILLYLPLVGWKLIDLYLYIGGSL
jgi:hypothetical protein